MTIVNYFQTLSNDTIKTYLPEKQLLRGSIQLSTDQPFLNWSKQDHKDSYGFMQTIAHTWKKEELADQYLIYGKVDEKPFKWEIVPYQTCKNVFSRILQQIKVLWRTVFGGFQIKESTKCFEHALYQNAFQTRTSPKPAELSEKSTDSFCNEQVINRQCVLTGKKVDVLYNYAPIGLGKEKLHFLVVPKAHRENFSSVTEEEYVESLELTQKIVQHYSQKGVNTVYLLNKSGKDAGQTVNHWHMHLIFSTNKAHDIWGKLSVLKNILFGSSPMKRAELEKKVTDLRQEFELIQNPPVTI